MVEMKLMLKCYLTAFGYSNLMFWKKSTCDTKLRVNVINYPYFSSVSTSISSTKYPVCTPSVWPPRTRTYHLDPFPTHTAKWVWTHERQAFGPGKKIMHFSYSTHLLAVYWFLKKRLDSNEKLHQFSRLNIYLLVGYTLYFCYISYKWEL